GWRSAASSYARAGVDPPVSTMWPPSRAADASMSATTDAGSSTTTMSTSLMRPRKLPGARHRRLHRVEKCRAHAGLLELADCGDSRPARRGDRFAQLDRMHPAVAQLLRRPEHRL